jgi:hypothetical protein
VAFPVTFESIISVVQATVAAYRASAGLVPLNGPDGAGTGTIALGQEFLGHQLAPPSIVVVPRRETFAEKDRSGIEDGPTPTTGTRYFTTRHVLEAWCWGDEDPDFATTGDTSYSFDSALELRREFVLGLVRLGDVPELGSISGEWDQPANDKRSGRMYVLTFEVKLPLDDDAPIFLPFATDSTSGVQVVTTILATSPDQSSTQQMGVIVAPPP